MLKQKKISLKDVAEELNVSKTLVSIVLNGKAKQYRISEEMTQKVIATANEMNYTPNLVAQNLRGGKTLLIGLIVSDISNPFFSTIARIVENKANALDYTVIFGSSDENYENTETLIDVLLNKGVDGLIIVPCDGSGKLIEKLQKSDLPIVLIDRYFKNLEVSFSCLNNVKATELATQHLIDEGYKNISLIAYKSELSNILDRISGYENTMKREGLKNNICIKKVNIINPKVDIYKAINQLVNKTQTEAIIFATNTISVHGLFCLNELKLKIPNDIAVVCFDGNDAFDLYYSPITYIEQPVNEIAEEAINILFDKIKTREQNKKSMVILDPKLIIRASSIKSIHSVTINNKY